MISDYPNFKDKDFSSIRFEGFEIYPKNSRMSKFKLLLTDYYYNNYRPKADANQKTSPMNFHPYKIQFYKCNPIKVFSCNIDDIDTDNPSISIKKYIEPSIDRTNLPSEGMPIEILSKTEFLNFCDNAPFSEVVLPLLCDNQTTKDELLRKINISKKEDWHNILPYINEKGREYLELRAIVVAPQKVIYRRS